MVGPCRTLITILGCAQAIIKLGLGLVSPSQGQKIENLSYRSDSHTADSYNQSKHKCTFFDCFWLIKKM
jgi:hypothetical protein